jgi:outer membrane protein TolC
MPHLRIVLLLAIALVAAPSGARAEDAMRESSQGGAPPPTLYGRLELSLGDAIRMGLENNLDVRVTRFDPAISYESSQIAWAPYDPLAVGEFGETNFEQPNTFGINRVAKNVQDDIGGSGGLTALVPYLNAQLGVVFSGNDRNTNSTIEALSPKLTSDLTFTATIPLLRNLLWSQTWTAVHTSKIGYGIALETFRTQVMDVVRTVELAYWNLIASKEQVGVQQATLETNRSQLDQVRTQYEVGVVSKVEVVQAEAGVSQAEFDLIVAENRYRAAQDRLIDLILGVQLTPESRLEVAPTDDLADYVAYEIDEELSVQKAFENRPELVIAEQGVRVEEVNLKFAKNQRLPQFDFQGSYGWNGVAGNNNPRFNSAAFGALPPAPNTTYGETFDDYFQDQGANSWMAKGVLTIPIGNIGGRHGVSQAELRLRKADSNVTRTRQLIIFQVRQEARNLRAAMLGIEAANRNVDATAEQLRAEQIRLEHGESTPFDVLQRQEQFVRAQSQQILALQAYQTAITELNRAQGTTLSARQIKIDDVAELR